MYTHLEDYIYNLLTSINITEPKDLTIENVTKKLKLTVVYRKKAFRVYDEIILQRGTRQQEWKLFVHELSHHLRHYGSQLDMHPLFHDLQEWQAEHFTYHFCVPTFMLEELKEVTVREIMNQFNVDYDFALRRFEMFKNKIYF
ncbi:ImmA/IrrE family metallo-endopeptidase [Cytobacillus horneckiae]|uniref:ImmA/IrrE family metallo-endopeptidase n=1 Tax=Cytobacillus horneckiae TaxID=549687 RepID=UPI002E215402|nr:ImmA/IrrE family metallo-endopeptidase [Cytobacillus horneckiae]